VAAVRDLLGGAGAQGAIGTILPFGDLLAAAVGAVWLDGRTCAVLGPDDEPARVAWLADLLGLDVLLVTKETAPLAEGFPGTVLQLHGSDLRAGSRGSRDDEAARRAAEIVRCGPTGNVGLVVVVAGPDEDVPVLFDAAACRGLIADRASTDRALRPGESALVRHPSFAHLAALVAFAGVKAPKAPESVGWVRAGEHGWYDPERQRLAVPEAGGVVYRGLAVLDRHGAPAGPGCVGEVAVVAGPLASCYPRDPERTAASFVPCPDAPDGRAFLVGARGVVLDNGTVRFFAQK
jgi:hypothetical protein